MLLLWRFIHNRYVILSQTRNFVRQNKTEHEYALALINYTSFHNFERYDYSLSGFDETPFWLCAFSGFLMTKTWMLKWSASWLTCKNIILYWTSPQTIHLTWRHSSSLRHSSKITALIPNGKRRIVQMTFFFAPFSQCWKQHLYKHSKHKNNQLCERIFPTTHIP